MDGSARATAINPGFSVADGESPKLELDGQTLTLRFVDWQECAVTVRFADAVAVRWQEAEHYYEGDDPYDGCSLVEDSPWVAEHVRQGCTFGEAEFRHIKLNFNAAGILEVLCTDLRIQE